MKTFLNEIFSGAVLGGAVLSGAMGCVAAGAQTHKVAKPENVVRAVGVYEWTGDIAKSTGSRLVPVTLFIDGKLEDAGEYMARPIPMAVLNGNVYELQVAGVGKGTLDLAYARHLATLDTAYDDGWFGYGAYKPEAPAKKIPALRQSKTMATVTTGSSSDKPHFSSKDGTTGGSDSGTTSKSDSSASTGDPDRPTMKRRTDDTGSDTASAKSDSSAGSAPAGDPDRPTMKRRTDDSSSGTTGGSTASAGKSDSSAPADDPDRPTMHRRTDDAGSDTASTKSDSSAPADDPNRPTLHHKTDDSGSGTGSTTDSTTTASTGSGGSGDDPDRPTLKRRTPEEAKKAAREGSQSSVTGVGSLNDDPNRPTIHRGKPVSSMTAEDLPPVKGLPTDVHQMVAVSDAVNRPQHDFSRPWENDQERAAVLGKMEAIARAQLATYGVKPAAKSAAPVAKKTTATTSQARSTKKPATPAPEPLLDEDLKGYMLSYGGLPTYVFQAHTAGDGAALKYVTVVAQEDGVGEMHAALKSVTDAAHLDVTPRMRLVDAVDVEASNRASLLFEMREQSSRQFALYQVIGARSDQIFQTGTTQ